MENFETRLNKDLHEYFLAKGKIDERMPECPDIEELWEKIGNAYLPDGAREFNSYPTVASAGYFMWAWHLLNIGIQNGKYIRR